MPRLSESEKIEKVKEIINDGNPDLVEALKALFQWTPHSGQYPLKAVSEIANGEGYYYAGDPDDENSLRDEETPFFCERFLYDLIGKEDARSLMARLHQVLEAAGLDRFADGPWMDEFFVEAVAKKKAEKARIQRRLERKTQKQ